MDDVTRYLVLRVVDEEPELLDPDVIAFTEWTSRESPDAEESISQIVLQSAKWSKQQGWLDAQDEPDE